MNDSYNIIPELIDWIDSYLGQNREALCDNDIECLVRIRSILNTKLATVEPGISYEMGELEAIAVWIIRLTMETSIVRLIESF